MANELSTLDRYFPGRAMASLLDDLLNVKTWEDFARRFLLGEGKSPNTTAAYLNYCRQFYTFTGGMHPMEAGTHAWIESFYDAFSKTHDPATSSLAMSSLRYLYKKICERFPAYVNPFDTMPKGLKAKLSRCKKDESERDSLTAKEYRALLGMLKKDASPRGLLDYALFRFGLTSGLRAAELCGLTWGMISEGEERITCTFIGKGSKRRTVQVEPEALSACKRAFRARWGRAPKPSDYVFNGAATGRARGRPGITKSCVHLHVKAIIANGKALGIIREGLSFSTHCMRHSFASLSLESGMDVFSLKEALGHSSLSTTARYLHNRKDFSGAWASMEGADLHLVKAEGVA